ncbi:MAG TPA: hypothetical protein VMT81_01075, partial [Candidatus Paceibacterota bacterium]|nr:hypothetical protein [Candidatus Paceibacterota bacterium]
MTRKVLVFFVVFCALAIMAYAQTSPAAPTSSMPAPALKAVNGFPQGFVIEMQNFLNMVWPVVLQVTTPAASTPAIIQIQPDTTICPGSWCSGTGTISAPTTENTATPFIMGDGIDFTHELMLQLLSVGEVNDIGRAEGIANGESELLYRLLVQQHPELFPAGAKPYATSAAGADMLANQRPTVFGGAGVLQNGTLVSDFYSNIGNGQYRVIASLLSVVIEKMGGDYRQLTADIDRYQPQTRADFLAMLDQVCPLVDGVKPSTFMKQDITNFPAAPTGVYFGMAPGGGYDANYPWFLADNWPFNLTDYSQVVAEYNSATIGVLGQNYPVFQNTATAPNPEPMMWTMYDASGTQVAATQSLDAREIINPSTQVMNSILFYDWSTNQDFYTFLPEGTYLTTACLGDSSCAADPRQNDDAFEVFLGGDELSPCSIAVVGNGPAWNELGTSLVPTLISPLSASFDQHGALWNYVDIPQNPDGSCEDVTVKAGPYVRTFTPSRYEPREVNFTKRQEPTFGAPTPANPSPLVRATDFQSPPVIVPEAIYSLFGWYFTWNDPWWPSGFPIPVEGSGGTPTNDQGRTEVVFTLADGTQFKSPILYVGGYNP